MTITYVGELTIGQSIPGAEAAAIAGAAGINLAIPDILARLAALQDFAPQPISFTAQLALAEGMLSSIQASIALGLPVPSIAAQIAIITALINDILASLTSINAFLVIITDFQALLLASGVHAYAYDGTTGNFGGGFAAELAGGTPGGSPLDHANAIVLITTVGATWVAMSEVFKVTP